MGRAGQCKTAGAGGLGEMVKEGEKCARWPMLGALGQTRMSYPSVHVVHVQRRRVNMHVPHMALYFELTFGLSITIAYKLPRHGCKRQRHSGAAGSQRHSDMQGPLGAASHSSSSRCLGRQTVGGWVG